MSFGGVNLRRKSVLQCEPLQNSSSPVTCTASPLSNITNVIVTTPFDRLPSTPLTHANSSSLNSKIRDTSLLKSCVTQDNVGEQWIFFEDDDDASDVYTRESIRESKFLAWMKANEKYPLAKTLTYAEFPQKFVWKADQNMFGKNVGNSWR
ncbi:unnamed protein product [Cuscuta campestris]|uniref:Uncharacterized protein n=1 Tax=Cuscuta campestris TaxID=132261 RepID=A0A484KD72_9ASTE|nr:unnamed protein product [Cuscuta campestris]